MLTFDEVVADDRLRNEELYINVPQRGQGFVAREVMCWYEDSVIVLGDLHDYDRLEKVTPLDLDGNCLLRIPRKDVGHVLTCTELDILERPLHENFVEIKH